MKFLFSVLCCVCLLASVKAQNTYETLEDSVTGQQMLKGAINKELLSQNPDFTWYAESQKIYPVANAEAVEALKKNKDKIYLIIFGGTWCEDTHFVLPKFFKIQEAAGFPEDRMVIYAVDRYKKSLSPIAEALGVFNVPSIIVMQDGKEKGRVVEYGKTGYWDKELADIINRQD